MVMMMPSKSKVKGNKSSKHNFSTPKLQVVVEESTDEGSASSDGESSSVSCPPPVKSEGAFSRSALRARGRETLARLAATAEGQQIDSVPALTHLEPAQWMPDAASYSHWLPEAYSNWAWGSHSWDHLPMPDVCGEEPTFLFGAPSPEEMLFSTTAPPGLGVEELAITPPPGLEGADLVVAPPPGLQQEMSDHAPMKVWLPESSRMTTQLEYGVPAKQRPPFPDYAGTPRTLDSMIPAKKRMPAFLEDIAVH